MVPKVCLVWPSVAKIGSAWLLLSPRTKSVWPILVLGRGLHPGKDQTRKYVMICMASITILSWNQGSGDPGCFKSCQLHYNQSASILPLTSQIQKLYILGNRNLLTKPRAEEFGQNYVRSTATSVDKLENSPQFSNIILRWMRWIERQKFNAFNAKCKNLRWIFQLVNASCRWSYIFSVELSVDLT